MPAPPDPSLRDELTGLSNRRHFDIIFDFAFHVATRGVPMTLAIFELDRSPEGGEGPGTQEGEGPLAGFARALAASTRTTDLAARLGEHRLVSLLVDCNQHGGLIYADRVLDSAGAFLEEAGLTASVGIAAYEKEMKGPEDLLSRAEGTLDGARAAGGNRTLVPSDLEEAAP